MDPSTTLFTFMLQTHPSAKSVHLCGSWDNFQKLYPMERDIRKDRGQWRGCYAFVDISFDGDKETMQKRSGGLMMGQTYYYYYELNGTAEVHDPTEPATNTCPFLPGQTVNILTVPIEKSLRKRRASLTSLRKGNYMTMNPQDKYISPRPAPPVPSSQHVRVGTAPAKSLKHKRSSRSPSPSDNPSWSVKRLFRMRSRERGREDSNSDNTADTVLQADDNSSIRSGSRSRDISPEALRIFLSNDIPTPIASHEARPTVTIPEEIVEEAEDDDNFASSAASENVPFSTVLSPPPFRRTQSSSSTASTAVPEVSTETVESRSESVKPGELTPILTSGSTFNKQNLATSYFSVSPFGDELHLPMTSLHTPNNTSFFNDSSDDEDDDPEGLIPDSEFDQAALQQTKAFFSTYYSLPYTGDGDRLKTANKMTLPPSPALIDGNVSIRDSGLLTAPTESGFNEVVSELGWMSNYI